MPEVKCPFCGMVTQYSKYIKPPKCSCGGENQKTFVHDFRDSRMATIDKGIVDVNEPLEDVPEVKEIPKKYKRKVWPE